MPGSMVSLVSQTASRAVGLIPFIQSNRSRHVKHAMEEDTESPSSEFPGQENKSPTPSWEGWHGTSGIKVGAVISREAEATPERSSQGAFRGSLPSLAEIRF